MRVRGSTLGALVALLAVACGQTRDDERAAAEYKDCLDYEKRGALQPAREACERATKIGPDSKSGKLAAKKLAEIAPQADAIAARRGAEARRAAETLQAKYREMTSDERKTALRRCLEARPRCPEGETNAIFAVATAGERDDLKAVADAHTPASVSFDELNKLSATGMKVGRPYKDCAYYHSNGSWLCRDKDSCPPFIAVEDTFAVGSDMKRGLYDRRGKTGCFEVQMFRGGVLAISDLLLHPPAAPASVGTRPNSRNQRSSRGPAPRATPRAGRAAIGPRPRPSTAQRRWSAPRGLRDELDVARPCPPACPSSRSRTIASPRPPSA